MFMKILKFIAPVAVLALVSVAAKAQPAPPNLEIRITHSAPPHARSEHAPPRPDHRAVWAKGYWHWEGARWDWMSGRWEHPEDRHYTWTPAHYRHKGNVWVYEPPHWSHHHLVEGDEYQRWKDESHHRS